MPRRGYRKQGYRGVFTYIRDDLYQAVVLRALRERKNIADIINEAIEYYLNAQTPRQPAGQPTG